MESNANVNVNANTEGAPDYRQSARNKGVRMSKAFIILKSTMEIE